MSENITPAEARSALDAVSRARRRVADEAGLPRGYWWAMAAGWVVLGVIGELGPVWLASAATLLFGIGHAVLASRLLGGRRPERGVQLSAATAGRRTPLLVVALLVGLVVLTLAVALLLDADGDGHPAIWAGALTAAVAGFGGPELLAVLRRWARA